MPLRKASGSKPKLPVKRTKRKTVLPNRRFSVSSVPFFRKNVKPGTYSFSLEEEWVYADKIKGRVYAPKIFFSYHSSIPHLILRDSSGKARFTLAFQESHLGDLLVSSVQRERTKYKKLKVYDRTYFEWSPELETQASKEFQKKLGLHPAEFLFLEFLHENRNKILERIKQGSGGVYLLRSDIERRMHLYKPLIERFFEKKLVQVSCPGICGPITMFAYKLNLRKKRVKQILGLN
jgi:hypothetical protein